MTTKNIFTGDWHEHEDRWNAVDAYAFPHSHPASRVNTSHLNRALEDSKAAGLPDISVGPAQGKFMALLCRAKNVTHALELGTLGGYSAVWLASENPQLKLTTIEYSEKHAEVARRNIEAAGLTPQVEVIQGAGLEVLEKLKAEVKEGKRERFGFVFIDADKQNNWNYFDAGVEMALPKAVICVDNVVRRGTLADMNNTDSGVRGGREVVEKAGKDSRVDSVVVQTVNEKSYDGCLWAVVN